MKKKVLIIPIIIGIILLIGITLVVGISALKFLNQIAEDVVLNENENVQNEELEDGIYNKDFGSYRVIDDWVEAKIIQQKVNFFM